MNINVDKRAKKTFCLCLSLCKDIDSGGGLDSHRRSDHEGKDVDYNL